MVVVLGDGLARPVLVHVAGLEVLEVPTEGPFVHGHGVRAYDLPLRPKEGVLMSQVSLFARFTAKEGKGDEIVAAFEPIIDQVRNEPGTLLYVMNRAKDDPNVFWFAELYADDDAFAAHGASEAMANAMPTLGPLIAETELVVGEPVLAKDLPGLAF
jgi:quinol monooxygenase YgiN